MPDLYALPPEEFTAARDARAKQARADGDRAVAKELAALRRPTVPAHLVNLLVRAEPDLVASLLELGGQLAEAQRAGSGDALRSLGEQRRALVQAVTARAVELGGRDVTAAVRGEVGATLEAALADPAAAGAVRSGRLVRALSYAGFGGADLDGAVAPVPGGADDDGVAPAPAPRTTRAARSRDEADAQARADARDEASAQARARAVADAEAAALQAAGALDDAVRACEQAQRDAERAQVARTRADDAVGAAEQALEQARQAAERAAEEADSRVTEAGTAQDAVRAAQDGAEAARAALDRLRRSG